MWAVFLCLVAAVSGTATSEDTVWPLCEQTVSGGEVQSVRCNFSTAVINGRNVYYQVPQGRRPHHGWPTMLIFHGWNLWAESSWNASKDDCMGLMNKAELVRQLLLAGYAVVTPNAFWNDSTQEGGYWYSNIDPYNRSHESDLALWNASSPDHAVMMKIFEQMPTWDMDIGKLHCAGFSSGGYMASRMGANYGVCKTLAILSASFYYCDNSCPTPQPFYEAILKKQVPTLFLQGSVDDDVPPVTQETYYQVLRQYHVPTRRVLQQGAKHQWIDAAPAEILRWIQVHGSSTPQAMEAAEYLI